MSTTTDASGVVGVDTRLVAVPTFSPRAAWTRMKIRVLEALRSIRAQAAARKAAIAQFVKPYWEKIPSGLPGFALLAGVTHTPAYRWLLKRAAQVALGAGALVHTGLTWTGRSIRWLARGVGKMIGWVSPEAGRKFDQTVLRVDQRVQGIFAQGTDFAVRALEETYAAASSTKAVRTAHQLGLPLLIAAGANLISQGMIAATISAIPVIGLPLAAAMTTTRGMAIATATIVGISTLTGWSERRKEDKVITQAMETVTVPDVAGEVTEVTTSTTGEVTEVKTVVETPEANVETREVLIGDKTVVIEVVAASKLTDAEAEEIALQHMAKAEADDEAKLKELEAEVGKGNAVAKAHGPAPKGNRGRKQTAGAR